MSKYDGILLASGGMDSTVLSYKLLHEKKRIGILFLDYGQKFASTELTTLKKVIPNEYLDSLKVINISSIYQSSSSVMITGANLWEKNVSADDMYLPYRNLLFLTIAASYAQSIDVPKVYSAFINSNHAKEIDCSKDFFTYLEKMLYDIGFIQLEMPFRFFSKTDVARLGLQLDVPIDLTFSCQINEKNPCGACPNCVDRLEALNNIFLEADNND